MSKLSYDDKINFTNLRGELVEMGEFNCLKHGNKRLFITILILFIGIIFCLSTYDFLMQEKVINLLIQL